MEKFLVNLNLIVFLIFFYKKIRQGLHILQLENYYNDRYAAWMKRYIKRVLNLNTIILLIIPIILFIINQEIIGLITNILAYGVLIVTDKKVKEKKSFVVTARVKRMYITYLIILSVIWILGNIINYRIVLMLVNCLAMVAYTFVYIVNLINRPIENNIRKKFCKKANQKLKEIQGLKVIGITGSYGKTSVKYIINTILSQKYNTLMTPESYNTTMGVVRTINEKLTSMHHFFICEMGAKYIGDIKEICDIVKPQYGVLTAIGPQHLDTFKSLENVRKTKMELVDSLPDENGVAFINWEDENIRNSKIAKNVIKYGFTNEAEYYAENISISENGSSFDVVIPDKERIRIKTRLIGKLNILNIVGAIAIADTLGLTSEEIKIGVKYIRPVPHRLELKRNPNGSIIIDDAYNSNNKGAKMALEVLRTFENKKRILITPGIVELGDKSREINKEFGINASNSSDFIILVGAEQAVPILEGIQENNYPQEKIFIAKNLEEAVKKMNEIMDNNSVILLENDLPDNYL